jgi:hypothetical protein
LLPLKTSDHFVPPTALIVRARTANPRNFIVRKHHTHRHALCLSLAKPHILLFVAIVWLLCLPCSTH